MSLQLNLNAISQRVSGHWPVTRRRRGVKIKANQVGQIDAKVKNGNYNTICNDTEKLSPEWGNIEATTTTQAMPAKS